MDTLIPSLAIVGLAALLHATFQLSVSVLTLLGGHSLSRQHSHERTLRLTTSFTFGAWLSTTLLLGFLLLLGSIFITTGTIDFFWTVCSGLLIGVGLAVWLFYYRQGPGTSLWISRGFAQFLQDRTKKTTRSAEAFSLGVTSVFAELLFIIAPLAISTLAIIVLPPLWQLAALAFYSVLSILPLLLVWVLLGGGHRISTLQKWRETNKRFLQVIAGSGLLILGVFSYVYEVLPRTIGGM